MKKIFAVVIICFSGLLFFIPAKAQKEDQKKNEKKHKRFKARNLSDSAFRKDFGIEDTASAMIISRIEDINNSLNDFSDVIGTGFDSSDISENLPGYERSLKFIKYNITNASSNLSLTRLTLFRSRLDDICDDMKDWQSSLLDYYTQLVDMASEMRNMFNDSSLRQLNVDTTLRMLYLNKLAVLKTKWAETDSVTRKDILRIDVMQNTVSNDYMDAVELQKTLKGLIRSYELKAFSKENNYLWETPPADTVSTGMGKILQNSFKISNKILGLYISANTNYQLTALAIFILFFGWTYYNFRRVKRNNVSSLSKLVYIHPFPILVSIIVMLVIGPFLDLQHPPTVYLEFLQILLIIPLSILIIKKWPAPFLKFWWLLVFLFIFYSIKSILLFTGNTIRIIAFVLNVFSIVLGYLFIRQINREKKIFPGYFKAVIILYMALNLFAAVFNLCGRVTLAQMFGSTAISNFVQVIGLVIFIEIIMEALFLQLEADKRSNRFTAYLNYQNIELRLRNFLLLIAAVFWFINLTQNLNVFELAYDSTTGFLSAERSIGNTSFTMGSVVTFFFALWVANFCQKYVGYFFGDTGDEMMPEKKSKFGTSILLIRLLILTAGFFIGVLASGIPLDKVTIVIGALGIGIGLGLQSIVNNLISGVILAIERPIQVGDMIEITSTAGKVKEIGIRSTRIVTPDGAEVLIPNGDMLSQKLINWTLSNSHLRVELDIKLTETENIDKIKEIVTRLLDKNEDVMKVPPVQILVTNISQAGADVQIQFWVFDINKWMPLKSDVLQKIYEECSKENINIAL